MLYAFDQFVLDTDRFEISKDGSPLRAEPQVIELLTYFLRNSGRLVTRDELVEAVWKGRVVSDSAISGRIKIARKLLGDNGRRQKYIRTIHKKGFAFIASAQGDESAGEPGNDSASREGCPAAVAMPGARHDPMPSIGVLRFTDLNGNPDNSYFADGLTEELITTLSKISKLVVVAHPGPLRSESGSVDARRAGFDLDVRHVLYGSVRHDGERLRVSVHLIATLDGQHLWAQRYDCTNPEIFELQDELTREVVSALQVELTEGDQALLLSRGTDDIEAWKLTFQGQAGVLAHHQDKVRRGREQLRAALERDENYALAWSTLALAHWKESLNEGWSESCAESLALAVEAGDRALALEPENAAILAMHGLILVSRQRFDEAFDTAMRALHLANSAADTIALAGIVLRACCEPELSILHTRKAMRLCPVYPAWYPYGLAVCYWMLGEFDHAVELANEAIEIDPEFSLVYYALAMIHGEAGLEREARDAVESLHAIDPKFTGRAYNAVMRFRVPLIEARRLAALRRAGLCKGS
jgi:TolB-like protein/Tfp pilus assembly protein PilF